MTNYAIATPCRSMQTVNTDKPDQFFQGPEVTPAGVRYRTWTAHQDVGLVVYRPDGTVARSIKMTPESGGFYSAVDLEGKPGDLYKYRFGTSNPFPDPATRYQPAGVHGPSMVVENNFRWGDDAWSPAGLRDLTIYELHIGTFTPGGTFAAAAEKLRHIADAGFTAIEIMPVADFPGERNWGYDGVCLYAPARVYGRPDDFRSLIDVAHRLGLTVILDVVYNHFGPDGNYLGAFHPGYFHPTHKTPWGSAFDFERPPVRYFFVQNIAYWMDEFHVDGFRLDATHAIVDCSDVHVLTEIAKTAQARGGFVIAEDDRNDPQLIADTDHDGAGLDGCWADDFHHVVNVMLTGNRDAYFRNYDGTVEELATTLERGWLFTGQVQRTSGRNRGGNPSSVRPEQLIYCISNHDQVGNRAFGERLSHVVSPAAYRAASALVLLAPYTPMVFMGQEWAATTPFQYFTDHNHELGQKIIAGRRREFSEFAGFRDPGVRETIPSPQARETFERSKLNWADLNSNDKARVLNLYRTCLKLRSSFPALRDRSREKWRVVTAGDNVVLLIYGGQSSDRAILAADLTGGGISFETVSQTVGCSHNELELVFDSNEEEFSGTGGNAEPQPRTVLLRVAGV
ncbi:MAG: malto-oligosyltrehalose trehalohydrolase [Chthoniobacterales bacterium]